MPKQSTQAMAERLLHGDPAALSRLISLIEAGDPAAPALMERVRPQTGRAHRIGITGLPGAGKSTLVNALTRHYRQEGKTLGILGVDPSSPYTGGALLGDRIRMARHYLDPGVFIRSMATRAVGVSLPMVAKRAMRLLDAAGRDIVILETVGVGQAELTVMEAVDTIVVVLVPEAGDAVQALKAGLLEVADIFVVNKADRSGAQRMAADLETSVQLGSPRRDWWTPPILLTEAYRDIGIAELAGAIDRHYGVLKETGHLEEIRGRHRRQEFLDAIQEVLAKRLAEAVRCDPQLAELLGRVERGEIDALLAATQTLGQEELLREWLKDLQKGTKEA